MMCLKGQRISTISKAVTLTVIQSSGPSDRCLEFEMSWEYLYRHLNLYLPLVDCIEASPSASVHGLDAIRVKLSEDQDQAKSFRGKRWYKIPIVTVPEIASYPQKPSKE